MLESGFRILRQVVPVGAAVLIGSLATGSAHAQNVTGEQVTLTSATPQVTFIDNVGPDTRTFRFLGFDADFRFEDITAQTIPFLISGGAPTGSIRVGATGQVGINNFFPDANSQLDVRSTLLNGLLLKSTTSSGHYLRVENAEGVFRSGVQGNGDAQFGALGSTKGLNLLAGGSSKMTINAAGQVSFGNPPPTVPVTDAMNTSTGAHLTVAGVWTNNSSRAAKQDIEPITSEQARDTVRALQPMTYRYKVQPEEPYAGFIAEDVPVLVATSDRKSLAAMDFVAVLTKVVQDQDKLLEDERKLNAEQRQELDQQRQVSTQQQELLTAQQAALAALTKRLVDLEQKSAGK